MKLWAVTWGAQEREALVYGDYTADEAVQVAKDQIPYYSPARGNEPSEVREMQPATLLWRPLNW